MVLHRCTDRYYARQQHVYEGQRLQAAPLTANHPAVELAETNEQSEVVASFAQLLSRLETALAVPNYPANLPPPATHYALLASRTTLLSKTIFLGNPISQFYQGFGGANPHAGRDAGTAVYIGAEFPGVSIQAA